MVVLNPQVRVRYRSPPFQKAVKNTIYIVNNEKIIVSIATRTLQIEADTLKGLIPSINDDFIACVNRVYDAKGRLVVTGIGKSALIGKKIVATLNSTGTPALFMHAADAIHGDLGMIQQNDIVLCVSKSGATPEIKVLIPLLRNIGNEIIGMVSRKDSYLAEHADYLLYIPVSQEADPNNLAPTASSTAQMAMGDALATALLALRGFTPNDFAQYHPGGALGKQLYLRVADLYQQNERPLVRDSDNIRTAIVEMTSKRLGMTVVIDEAEQICGIITDGDLRRMLERAVAVDHLQAKDIMTPHPQTISADALAVKALEMMRNGSITQLVVTKEDRYAGVIHLHDLLREGLV